MNEQVRFDRYRFEPLTARLWTGDREIRLTPKAAAVLRLLLGRAGEPVTKRELFASVWSNRFVGDDALTTCIRELRRALSDNAKDPRYIETRHRSGYRFVAPLSRAVEATVTEPESMLPAPSLRKEGDRLRITVELVDAASGCNKWSHRFERSVGDVSAIQDEIAEDVAIMCSGALRREKYTLRRRQVTAEAQECFLRGRQHLHVLGRSDLDRSRGMFERAIAIDEHYAPAWAGLATVHALSYEWWGTRDEDLEQADRTSRIAMEMDSDSGAYSHIARGYVLALSHRCADAQQHFEAAVQIDPNLFEAHYYYGRECFASGDIERSADLFCRAAELRREDFQSPLLQAQALRMLERAGEARAASREGLARTERTLALNPLHARALSLGSAALYDEGETGRAMEWSRRALELAADDMGVLVNFACLKIRAGLNAEALDILERIFNRGWGKCAWIDQDPDYDVLRDDARFQLLLKRRKQAPAAELAAQ